MSVSELCRLRRDDQITGQRQFERAGVAVPMHRADDRLRKVREALDRLGLKIRLRRALALRDVGEIMASGEALAGATDDDQTDAIGLARKLVDVSAQFDKHLDVERVQFLGTIQCERGETVPVFAKHQSSHDLSSERSQINRRAAGSQICKSEIPREV